MSPTAIPIFWELGYHVLGTLLPFFGNSVTIFWEHVAASLARQGARRRLAAIENMLWEPSSPLRPRLTPPIHAPNSRLQIVPEAFNFLV